MDKDEVARAVLVSLGGADNVLTNTVCMTRLRVTLANPGQVDYERLADVRGVLGTAIRGSNGLEVVFGPRMIDGIYHAFIKLTGKAAGSDELFPMSRQETNMHVQIRTEQRTQSSADGSSSGTSFINDSELSLLEDIFGRRDDDDSSEKPAGQWRLLVVNGPNLNMLGVGSCASDEYPQDFPALLELCKQAAQDVGFARCDCFQSNHEGDLVDKIQDAFGMYEAIVINPGAYGTSSALFEALRTVCIPSVEVHLTKREQTDIVGDVCVATTSGHGVEGYRRAIIMAAQYLNGKR
ncbi:MAG: type II 3-dehydroquinate dehydratase [Atopobiaceae bacterium]|nr:type II 3-dehydroquinate dehydratase [Atopobiaceae bacterium]